MNTKTKRTLIIGGVIVGLAITGYIVYTQFFKEKASDGTQASESEALPSNARKPNR